MTALTFERFLTMPASAISRATSWSPKAATARGFLRQRLQVGVTWKEEEPADSLPIELNGLEVWTVGERVLTDRLKGLDPAASKEIERRRGDLPPGPLGAKYLQDVLGEVDRLIVASTTERAFPPESYDVDVPLADGTRLTGTVGDVRDDAILSITYSSLGPKQKLHAWVQLLALTISQPDREWRAVAVGRGERGRPPKRSVLGPIPVTVAEAALEEIVALYRTGLRSPLPLPIKTTGEYARVRYARNGVPAARAGAAKKWVSGKYPAENAAAEHVLIYGAGAPYSVLTDQPLEPGEGGPGWPADESDRFGLLAGRVWGRLLSNENAVQT